jgi:hypothetical protein
MENSSSETTRVREVEGEFIQRRQELLNTILRNFEVTRLNLHYPQFSPELSLISFYEATALSGSDDHTTDGKRELEALRRFEAASKLVEFADALYAQGVESSSLREYWIVGFHARYNAVVLRHRQVVARKTDLQNERLNLDAYKDLREITNNYETLDAQLSSSNLAEIASDLLSVKAAVLCGRLSCLCSQLAIAQEQQMRNEETELVRVIDEARQSLVKHVDFADQASTDSGSKLHASAIKASMEHICPAKMNRPPEGQTRS